MSILYILGYMYPRLTLSFFETKISIALLGIGLILTILLKKRIIINKNIFKILIINSGFIFALILSSVYNAVFDSFFVTYLGLELIFLLYLFVLDNNKIGLNKFIKIYVIIMTIQSTVGIYFYMYPKIGIYINNLIYFDLLQKKIINGLIGLRFVGVGIAFFGAGIDYGITLIFIVYLYFQSKKSYLKYIYVYNLIIGIFYARTTLVGCMISLILTVCLMRKEKIKTIKKIFLKGMIVLGLTIIGVLLLLKYDSKSSSLFHWAFELFFNFFKSGKLESRSVDGMLKFYKVLPDNIKTWILGDSYWHYNDGYYKNIDIGYLRMLFFSGCIGTFIWVFSKILLFVLILKSKKNYIITSLSFCILIFDLILNLKGYVSLNSIQYALLILNIKEI